LHVLHGPRGVAYEGERMSRERRLRRLERQYIGQIVTDTAQAYGVSAEDLLADTRQFFALSDDEQEAELAASLA
jgi:hypothetical protein